MRKLGSMEKTKQNKKKKKEEMDIPNHIIQVLLPILEKYYRKSINLSVRKGGSDHYELGPQG